MENKKSTTSRNTGILIVVAAIAGIIWMSARNTTRPQLNVTNTGSTAVSARHGSDEFVIQPAQSWALRYSVGDTLTLSVAAASKSQTVELEREGRGIGMRPVKLKAEVNADGEEIRFRFIDGE
jgi:hypothetical protein